MATNGLTEQLINSQSFLHVYFTSIGYLKLPNGNQLNSKKELCEKQTRLLMKPFEYRCFMKQAVTVTISWHS